MHFIQLNIAEREEIYKGKKAGISIRQIAKRLKRSPTTISREFKRNTSNNDLGYLPDRAQLQAKNRKRINEPKINRNAELKSFIIKKLKNKDSPEIIADAVKKEPTFPFKVCTETIYQFVYGAEGQKLGLSYFLVTRQKKRCEVYGRKKRNLKIPERISIHERPKFIYKKLVIGHGEVDLTFVKGNQSGNIGTFIDKRSRYVILFKNQNKTAKEVMKNLHGKLAELPSGKVKTATFDNGSEFVKHRDLWHLGIETFFCDPGSPWQKGQIENMHRILHWFLPKGTPFYTITDELLVEIQEKMNNRPRKCLGFKTPKQVFFESI